MEHLKTRMTEPAGGWRYRDEDLKVYIRAATFNKLIAAVRLIRTANSLPVQDNLTEIIEDYICRHTARVFVDKPSATYIPMVMASDMINAMAVFTNARVKATAKHKAVGRQDICIKCQHNCPTVCLSCYGHDTRYRAEYHLDVTPQDALLHVCQIDQTALVAVVQMNLADIERYASPVTQYPEHCWKKETP